MSAVRIYQAKPILWVWVLMMLVSGLPPVAYVQGAEVSGEIHSHVATVHVEMVQERLTTAFPEGTTVCCHLVLSLCVSTSVCFIPSQAVQLIPIQGRSQRLLDTEPILQSAISLVPTPPPRA